MFCDALQKTTVTMEQLKKKLAANTAAIVEKVSAAGNHIGAAGLEEEVILIKLAERLHNMRTVEFMDE